MKCGVGGPPYKTPGTALTQRTAWLPQHPVGRFRSSLCRWSIACSEACECDAEEQTVNHVVLQCPIHRPPHGLHGLKDLDDETIEWLLNTFAEI